MKKSVVKKISFIALIISLFAVFILIVVNSKHIEISFSGFPESYKAEDLRSIEAQYKQYRRLNGYFKSDKPNGFAQYFNAISKQIDETESSYPLNYQQIEYEKAIKKRNKRGEPLPWIQRGPVNVAGRTRCILVDPDDWQHQTWYVGSASGGVWKTEDKGFTWRNLTPNLPNLSTSTLAMSLANTQIIYAGTGEGIAATGMFEGSGIFKSVNKGETWTQLSETAGNEDFRWVFRLAISPQNANILLAATNAGIMKTTDGGLSWRNVFNSTYIVQDLKADPTNFNIMYAAENSGGIVKSDDGGENWFYASDGLGQLGRRYELAISPANTNKIFCSVEVDENTSYIYVSKDKAKTWARFQSDVNFLEGQGWYDNTIAAHPFDENTVYVGGVNIWEASLEGDYQIGAGEVMATDTVNTSFLDFVNFGGAYFGGGMDIGQEGESINLSADDFTSIEIRFGEGKKQKAHRFTVPPTSGTNKDGGAGVAAKDYQYIDFVEVPFEVWDITHNKQLCVSFRDQERDGLFNLTHRTPDDAVSGREYIFIHALDYNDTQPNTLIAKSGGHAYKQIYFFWTTLQPKAVWDAASLPESNIYVKFGSIYTQSGVVENISDAYGLHSRRNTYFDGDRIGEKSIPGLHPDHHHLLFVPTSATDFFALCANDGGMAISENQMSTWRQISTGIINTQFYGVAKKPGQHEYIGGLQDNGTWRSPKGQTATTTSEYVYQVRGDGFEAIWHAKDPNKLMGSSYYNDVYRSLDGGQTWQSASNRIKGDGPFVVRFGTSKTHPDVVFTAGLSGVWRSENFGALWRGISISETEGWKLAGDDESRHIVRVSLANEQVVWAGEGMAQYSSGSLHLFVSTNEGRTFSATNNFDNEILLANISGLTTHPYNDQVAYALFSVRGKPKILRTSNLGETWEDISGFNSNGTSERGFPDVQVYTLLVMPHNPNILWAGTNIGIVESLDNGKTWALADNGLPAVSVWELKVVDDQIVVATHGRGIWSLEVPELRNGEPQNSITSPAIISYSQNLSNMLKIRINRKSIYDSLHIVVNNLTVFKVEKNTQLDSITLLVNKRFSGNIRFKVIGYKNQLSAESITNTLDMWQLYEPVSAYTLSVKPDNTDFSGDGFEIALKEGFRDYAIHSPHPYSDNKELTYLLRKPLILKAGNTTFSYRDVAIVQSGKIGSVFGNWDFFDYAVFEGSKDGSTWIPISDGYNAAYSTLWQTPFNFRMNGSEEMLIEHRVDLLKKFQTNDTILVRFRLFSDNQTNAWGWAIAGLDYGTSIIETQNAQNEGVKLYPNPAQNEVNIEHESFSGKMVRISIFDTKGMEVASEMMYVPYQKIHLQLPHLLNGIYLLVIKTENRIFTSKLQVSN